MTTLRLLWALARFLWTASRRPVEAPSGRPGWSDASETWEAYLAGAGEADRRCAVCGATDGLRTRAWGMDVGHWCRPCGMRFVYTAGSERARA